MLRHVLGGLFRRIPVSPVHRRRAARRRALSYRPGFDTLEDRVVLSTFTWARPVSGDWDNPANWAGGLVPGVTGTPNVPDTRNADVVIPFRAITVTHATDSVRSIVSLTSEANLDVSAGSLSLTGGNGIIGGSKPSRTDGLITVRGGGALTVGSSDDVGLTLGGSGSVQNSATLHLNSGSILDLAVDNEAGVLLDQGSINNDAARPFVNGPNATLRLTAGAGSFVNGFTNQGRMEFVLDQFRDFATLTIPNGTLVNATGATLDFNGGSLVASVDNQGTISVESFGGVGRASGTVTNEGTIDVEPDRFTALGDFGVSQSAFTNSGTITVNRRAFLSFSQSVAFTNTGTITLTDPSESVAIGGGTFQQNGTLSGPGTLFLTGITTTITPDAVGGVSALDVSASTITSPGPLTNLGSILGSTINADVVNNGSLTAGNGGTVNGAFTNAAGASLFVTGNLALTQSFTNDGSIVLGSGGLDFNTPAPGNLTVPQSLTNNGSVLLVNGDITVPGGTLTNAPGGTFALGGGPTDDGSGARTVHAALDNRGTLNALDSADLTGGLANSGTLTIQSGVVSVTPSRAAALAPTVSNTGILTVTSFGALTVTGGDFATSGTVSLAGFGGIVVAGNYLQTAGSTQLSNGLLTASLVDLEGGVLAGTGVVNANVLNNAEVDVGQPGAPGTLTVVGDYTQTSASVLVVEIGGPNAGTDFDQLNITGQATLDGTLTVRLINGFVPNSGDSFTIMTFGSGTGAFATLNGDGPLFTPSFDPTGVTLVAN
jgi:hypothetical protein